MELQIKYKPKKKEKKTLFYNEMLPKRKYINIFFKFLNQNIKTNQYKIFNTKIINIEKYWQRNIGKNRMMISCLGLGDYQGKLCVQKVTGCFQFIPCSWFMQE